MMRQILLIASLFASLTAQGQYLEAGGYLGGANYLGDLSGQRLSNEAWHGMFGLFARFNATKRLSIKATLAKASISGSDANAATEAARLRNLSFRSDLMELGLTSELNFSDYNIRDNKTSVPYFFTGLALTYFNPEAQMRGIWHDLQPLQTEGQAYRRASLAIPFGLGIKFNLSYKLNIGLEVGARRTFTDYLDDVSTRYPDVMALRGTEPLTAALSYRSPEVTGVFEQNPMGSQRGDSNNKDWYVFGGVTVSVNLTDKYGLDFDPKYHLFKNRKNAAPPVTDEANPDKPATAKPKKTKRKHAFRLFKKKTYLAPQVKKRSSPKPGQ